MSSRQKMIMLGERKSYSRVTAPGTVYPTEAARMLGLTVGRIYKLCESGALEYTRDRQNHRIIKIASIERYKAKKNSNFLS